MKSNVVSDGQLGCLVDRMADIDAACWLLARQGRVTIAEVNAGKAKATQAHDAAIAAVRGNRSDDAPYSWEDMRLIMIRQLHRCLEQLEPPVPDHQEIGGEGGNGS